MAIPRAKRHHLTLNAEERSPLRGSDLSNSHSGALLTRVDWTLGCIGRGTSVGCCGGGDVAATAVLVIFLALALVTGSLSDGLCILLVLVYGPVEHVVVLEALTNEKIAEDLTKVGVVGLVVESEGSGVVQINRKLVREATAEYLGGGRHLLLHDAVVLLLLSSSLQALPRKGATAEVEHDITQRFHVITAGLFYTSKLEDDAKGTKSTYRHPSEC